MSISHDRVHFNMPNVWSGRGDTRQDAIVKAAVQAFGIPMEAAKRASAHGVLVICRPSQFARFLILRNEYGGENGFKNLYAKLVPAPKPTNVLDVSQNPALDLSTRF